MINQNNNKLKSKEFFSGWAMVAYPESSAEEFRGQIKKQKNSGCNFIWIGHNNPGEADADKVEPAMSYAIYDAVTDTAHPQHTAAKEIMAAQLRFLTVCREEKMPVVFPVGYQSQMGKRWSDKNTEHLRQYHDGSIVDWGGRSACIYSPLYREDILRYYKWIITEIVRPFSDIIKMINLADEPSGADFSPYADKEFEKRYKMSFKEAGKSGDDGIRNLGEFKAQYMIDYAVWSAEQWELIFPDIITTMSFCGFHGREEGCMPYIPDVFKRAPKSFQPTWDVYPRDGDYQCPVKETDITPLLIFLERIAELSEKYRKAYWLWTTGNSWGLGQNSSDKANISDAIANILYVVSSAKHHNALLRGIAVWNYNIKTQGLYNDTNPIIYNPDDMFYRLTKALVSAKRFMEESDNSAEEKTPATVLTVSRDYVYRYIGSSDKIIQFFPANFKNFHKWAKSGETLFITDSIKESIPLVQNGLKSWLIISDKKDIEFSSLNNWNAFLNAAKKGVRITLSAGLVKYALEREFISEKQAELFNVYYSPPDSVSDDIHVKPFALESKLIYNFSIGDTVILYNLTKSPVPVSELKINGNSKITVISPNGCKSESPVIEHHGFAVVSYENPFWETSLSN